MELDSFAVEEGSEEAGKTIFERFALKVDVP